MADALTVGRWLRRDWWLALGQIGVLFVRVVAYLSTIFPLLCSFSSLDGVFGYEKFNLARVGMR
ncbi:hypothetical protein DMJ13_10705 [halophilic archaeon]|nr:hypothetical protein DMJ13_10705 [halophilic archaeon]